MTVFDGESLTAHELRSSRTSVKWERVTDAELPMFIAEMDYQISPLIAAAMVEQIERSDLGYTGDLSELASAFCGFSRERWGWDPDPQFFTGAPDVSFGVKAALRHFVPTGGTVALATPIYPSFFGYLTDLSLNTAEIPLTGSPESLRLDVPALEEAFAASGDERVHALILSNPHNPHGIVHDRDTLAALAAAAARHGTLIIADEIHAPLTHHGVQFTPFAPLAEAAGTLSVTVTSASKGWNIAGTKCALIYAPPATSPDSFREYLAVSLSTSASILGRTASIVAFRDAVPWLDRAIDQVTTNAHNLVALLAEHLPGARYTPPSASYLAWIDLRDAGLGANPARTLAEQAGVIVSDGATFGRAGEGFIRLNLGCTPTLLAEAVTRMGRAAVTA